MPGASSPWLDTGPPAQFVFGSGGAGGPARPDPIASLMNNNGQVSQTVDTVLHWKLAGTIILALVTVFVLQALGFRFVVAAGVGS